MKKKLTLTAPSGNVADVEFEIVSNRVAATVRWYETESKADRRWCNNRVAEEVSGMVSGPIFVADSTFKTDKEAKSRFDEFLYGGGRN